MEVITAESAGFCFGVRRAVDGVYEALNKGRVVTYGPIIHNKNVVSHMEGLGVRVIEGFNELTDETVIIRSHGVPPKVYEELEGKKLSYIDYTCPFVKKIHHLVLRDYQNDRKIIILGNENHPEVIGINGWADDTADIIGSVADIEKVQWEKEREYTLVSQTTFSVDAFAEITQRLKNILPHLNIENTICLATTENQKQAEELSKRVDKMIIIGDNSSSNTKKLYDISKKNQKNTYLVESIDEIELNIFSYDDKIGITAGASTPPAIIKEAVKLMSDFENNDQTFEEMLGETIFTLHTGDIVKGTVILVSNGEVLVNLGYKSDGIIQRGQYSDDPDVDPATLVKPGEEIEVFVVRVNDGDGNVLLSKKRIDSQKGMTELEEAAESGAVMAGKIIEVVKGGVIAIINGIRAFVPSSQVSNRFIEDLNTLKGQEFNFNIIEFDKAKRRIVAGRKELAAKEANALKEKAYETIAEGDKVNGVVSRIADFGAFVDIGGVDGLIHISELSWGRVRKVSDVLKEGDKVVATILKLDKEKGKISLSLKDITNDPWNAIEEKYPVGSIVSGKVVRMVPFGAFVELEEGVDGLVHISQISDKHVVKPEDELRIGEIIEVKVTEINNENKKISLSKKAAEGVAVETDAEEVAVVEAETVEAVTEEVQNDEE